MFRRLALLSLALVTAPALAAQRVDSDRYHYFIGEAPAWVVEEAPAAPSAAGGQVLQVLLLDRQVNAESAEYYVHNVLRIQDRGGIDGLSDIQLGFIPDYQTLTLHRFSVIRDGTRSERLTPAKVRLFQTESELDQRQYIGAVTASIILDDLRVGDTVEYAYTVQGRNPVFSDRFSGSFELGWKMPVQRLRVRVLSRPDRPLALKSFATALRPTVRRQGRQQEYRWAVENPPAYLDEGETPVWYRPGPWAQLSEYADWADVGRWAEALFRFDEALPAELRDKAQAWKARLPPEQRVAEALRLVQDEVRYLGLEIGENSHRPYPPSETWQRRYGDCKDKAVLLVALLREMGVEAYPALVSSGLRRGIADLLPTPNAFDHVIVMANVNGQRYWLDGTRTGQRGPLERMGFSRFDKALVVGLRDANGLTNVIPPPGYESAMRVEERFVAKSYDAPVDLYVTTVYTGGYAESRREYFASQTPAEVSHGLLNYYARHYPGVQEVETVRLEDDPEANTYTIREHYRAPGFWERREGYLEAALKGRTVSDYLSLPNVIQRQSPLGLSYPVNLSHESILELPTALRLDVEPDDIQVGDDFVSYRTTSRYHAGRFHVTHRLLTLADAVPAEAVAGYIAKVKSINQTLHYYVRIPADQASKETGLMNDLQKSLDRLDKKK